MLVVLLFVFFRCFGLLCRFEISFEDLRCYCLLLSASAANLNLSQMLTPKISCLSFHILYVRWSNSLFLLASMEIESHLQFKLLQRIDRKWTHLMIAATSAKAIRTCMLICMLTITRKRKVANYVSQKMAKNILRCGFCSLAFWRSDWMIWWYITSNLLH